MVTTELNVSDIEITEAWMACAVLSQRWRGNPELLVGTIATLEAHGENVLAVFKRISQIYCEALEEAGGEVPQ